MSKTTSSDDLIIIWFSWNSATRRLRNARLSNCYCSGSAARSTQNCPCPPNTLLVKVKDSRRSAPQLVRGPQATRAADAALHSESPLPFFPLLLPFLSPAFDGCETTLKRVSYVSDKMGLYRAHFRFNEHVFLIKHSFIHHVSVKEACT